MQIRQTIYFLGGFFFFPGGPGGDSPISPRSPRCKFADLGGLVQIRQIVEKAPGANSPNRSGFAKALSCQIPVAKVASRSVKKTHAIYREVLIEIL